MAINALFKSDDYISVNVGLEKASGTPFVLNDLVGVLTTGSGSATNPVPDGLKHGLGNKNGWASVALAGGFRVPVPSGATYAVGETVYINQTTGVLGKTSGAGYVRFGKVTHEPKTSATGAGFVVVKITQ